jgi:hypothetical protein
MTFGKLMHAVERRDARHVAKRVHETSSQIFGLPSLAISQLEIRQQTSSPGTFWPKPGPRTELVWMQGITELLAKMDDYNGDAVTRLAMKLMTYTVVQTSEEIEVPWTEFDLDEARWTIPGKRMKMNTPHIVPSSHCHDKP